MDTESVLRISCYVTILVAVAVWETLSPKRPWIGVRRERWLNHLLLAAINAGVVRVVIPISAVALSLQLESHNLGLLNKTEFPFLFDVVIAVLLLDLAIYAQHYYFHKIPFFWRFHRMHHTDREFDVTTGVRFHPIEIVISMAIKFVVISIIGAPAVAIIAFEILLNATSLFNHGNVRIPASVDRLLRLIVVTPDMHRVHHSIIHDETDSNFGFNLPWWDRLFGTYRAQPRDGHQDMTIGLEIFRDVSEGKLGRLITQPFRKPV